MSVHVEKLGLPRDVFVTCPECKKIYYIERLFYDPSYDHVKLHCPFCHNEFDKRKSPQVWGL